MDNKFTLVCPKHGEFKICLSKLREGCRCPKCSAENKVKTNEKLTVEQVSKRVTDKYGDKFSVDWSTYKGYRVNGLKVICPIHGEFITSAYKLVHSKNGCPKCN